MNDSLSYETKLQAAKEYLGRHWCLSDQYDPAAHPHHNVSNKVSFVLTSWRKRSKLYHHKAAA